MDTKKLQIQNKEEKYKKALDFLFSQLPMFSRTGAAAYKPGLDTSIALAEYFGNPHKKFRSIHVGGTNGKGSTSHLIASVLQSQGYKIGLYTSPHLVDFRERIRINGEMIPKEKVVDFVEKWKNCGYEGKPSFFELTMIMAFNHFAEEKVDYAVIEVGMGGRLDSTNIITPIISVITNISHDHNQFLGETLQQIAGEKAGIIKPDIPVVIGEKQPETENIFRQTAMDKNAPICFADQEEAPGRILFDVLPLKGDYQQKNLVTVFRALETLRKSGVEISDEAIIDGIANVCTRTGLAGRWMIVSQAPLVIADTGHNTGGLTYNFRQLHDLKTKRPGARLRIVIGFVADKAIDKILKLLPKDAVYYVTQASIPRALDATVLMERMKTEGLTGKVYPDVPAAFEETKKDASEKDIIFIGGSTFIVADFLAANFPCRHPCVGHGSSTDCC